MGLGLRGPPAPFLRRGEHGGAPFVAAAHALVAAAMCTGSHGDVRRASLPDRLPRPRPNRMTMATAAASGRTKEPTSLSGLGRALVQHQLLRLDQASAIQRKADKAQVSFVDEIISGGHMPARQLAQFAAELCGHPLLDLSAIEPTSLPADLLDRKLATELRVVALGKRGGRLSIAVSDPTDSKLLDRIRFSAQAALDPIVVEHDRLVRLVERLGQSTTEQLEDFVDDSLDDIAVASEEQAPAPDTSDVDEPRMYDQELLGYGCNSLEVRGNVAICAQGKKGVEVIPLK